MRDIFFNQLQRCIVIYIISFGLATNQPTPSSCPELYVKEVRKIASKSLSIVLFKILLSLTNQASDGPKNSPSCANGTEKT